MTNKFEQLERIVNDWWHTMPQEMRDEIDKFYDNQKVKEIMMSCDPEKEFYIVPVAGAIRIYIKDKLYEMKMTKDDMADLATEILAKRIQMYEGDK